MPNINIAKLITAQVQKRVREQNQITQVAKLRFQHTMFSTSVDQVQHIKNKFLSYLNKDLGFHTLDIPSIKFITKNNLNFVEGSDLTFNDIENYFNHRDGETDLPCFETVEETAEHYLMKVLLSKITSFQGFVDFIFFLHSTDLREFASGFLHYIKVPLPDLNINNYIGKMIDRRFSFLDEADYFTGKDNLFSAYVCFTTLCEVIELGTRNKRNSKKLEEAIVCYRNIVVLDDYYNHFNIPTTNVVKLSFSTLCLAEDINALEKKLQYLCDKFLILHGAYQNDFSCEYTSSLLEKSPMLDEDIEYLVKKSINELLGLYLTNKKIKQVAAEVLPSPITIKPGNSGKEENMTPTLRLGNYQE